MVHDIACLSVVNPECPDLSDYSPDKNRPFPEDQDHFLQEQMKFFDHLWYDFLTVMCAKPGRTLAATHHIKVGDASPLRLRSYAIPHNRRDAFKEELLKLIATGSLSHQMHLGLPQIFLSLKRLQERSGWCVITAA